MNIKELLEGLAKHHVFLCPDTIKRYIKRGWIDGSKDMRGWWVFPDGETVIERIKGLLDGTIKLEG